MAWIYKQKGSANWWIGYRANGREIRRSTKTSNRAEAEKQLAQVDSMFAANKAKRLTKELFELLTGKESDATPLKKAADDWLAATEMSVSPTTIAKYRKLFSDLQEFIHATDSAPLLSEIRTDELLSFLIAQRKTRSASTVNTFTKIIGGFFNWQIDNGRLAENPTRQIKPFKEANAKPGGRRAFTVEEIQQMHDKAPSEFWRYMVIAGTYTGLRMGDLICLPWGGVDLQANRLTIQTRKTRKRITIPIRGELHALLSKLRKKAKKKGPSDHVWPEEAERYQAKGSGMFSNEFYSEILVPCGLAAPRNKQKAKDGRSAKRDLAPLSFHCLRHSFISFLKATGGNQAVAKELAGHSSDLVSDAYTHMPDDVLEAAIKQLPVVVE